MSTNGSGIHPTGNHVLVLPDEKKETTTGGIYIPEDVRERSELHQVFGTLVERGAEAWSDCEGPWATEGDRIMFGKHAGIIVVGKDKIRYRIINDLDITAKVDDEVVRNATNYD